MPLIPWVVNDQSGFLYLTDCTRFDHWSTGLCSEAPITDCSGSFLTGINAIPDSALSASIPQRPKNSPDQGRLDNQKTSSTDGCWASPGRNSESWIQVYIMQKQHVVILCM